MFAAVHDFLFHPDGGWTPFSAQTRCLLEEMMRISCSSGSWNKSSLECFSLSAALLHTVCTAFFFFLLFLLLPLLSLYSHNTSQHCTVILVLLLIPSYLSRWDGWSCDNTQSVMIMRRPRMLNSITSACVQVCVSYYPGSVLNLTFIRIPRPLPV